MKTHEHLYLVHFFLEWEMFQTNVLEKSKYILCPTTSPNPTHFVQTDCLVSSH